jgi:Immunoglobulin-like domain of bacterial spore germination
MLDKILYVFLAIAIITGVARLFINNSAEAPADESVACTMDAMLCPDGSYVGRSGPKCEFVCPELPAVDPVIQAGIDAKADLIKLVSPVPGGVIENGVTVSGQARGQWFFEASFPVVLTNWDGLIIAEGIATAEGEWMTTEFVPFSATLNFVNPYSEGNPDYMKGGSLILKKDNPSGLPENDKVNAEGREGALGHDALEIPIRFAP